jgi:uncharacterized protein (TIGR02246 family)
MTPLDTVIAEQQCRNLIAALVLAQDRGDAEAAAGLFAADGVWVRSGKPHAGRDAIRASFDSRDAGTVMRHIASNQLVTVSSPTEATATSYYLVYVHKGGDGQAPKVGRLGEPVALGEWHDSFVLTAEGWRFARREGRRVLER